MGAGSNGVSPGNYVGRRVLSSQGAAPAALLGAHVRRAGAVLLLLLLEALSWRLSPLSVSNVRAHDCPLASRKPLVPDATQFYFIFIFILKFKKVLSCNDREHNCLRLVCPPWRLYLSHVYVSRLPACPLLGSGGPRRARACDPEVHRGPGLLHFRPRPALPRGARGGEAL
jgi:hypothetical protein